MAIPICSESAVLKKLSWNETSCYQTPLALAIGSFDAIHYGHQALLEKRFENLESWVLYFHLDPQALHQPQFTGMVRSEAQRLEIFHNLALNGAFRLDFSPEISKMDGIDFIDALSRQLAIKQLVVGEDFRLGKGALTTISTLKTWARAHNIEVEVVPLLSDANGVAKYSSSTLREAVVSGDFEAIAQACGYRYAIDLRKVTGKQKNGVWYYDLRYTEQVIPQDGHYQTIDGHWVTIKEKIISSTAWLEQVLL